MLGVHLLHLDQKFQGVPSTLSQLELLLPPPHPRSTKEQTASDLPQMNNIHADIHYTCLLKFFNITPICLLPRNKIR